jgi:galactokinase
MDHAAVLAGRKGHAIRIGFAPLSIEPVAVPDGWTFLIAHCLHSAEKSGHVRAEYNSRRTAGTNALAKLGLHSYRDALRDNSPDALQRLAGRLDIDDERLCYLHVVTEAARVGVAIDAMRTADAISFGDLLYASHVSLRDQLRVSCDALDELVEAARAAGARGARLTGAGFGGCAVVFCLAHERERVAAGVIERYYAKRTGFDPSQHLIEAVPSAGALFG